MLPTAVDIDRLRIVGQQDLNSSSKLRGSRNENRSACSRAEVVQVREHSDPSQVRSLTRILTKMVEQPVVAADEDKVQIPEVIMMFDTTTIDPNPNPNPSPCVPSRKRKTRKRTSRTRASSTTRCHRLTCDNLT